LAGSPDGGRSVVDLGSFVGRELVEVLLDAVNEVLQPADLRVGGQGLGLGPLLQLDRCEYPFAVTEQIVEVCLEIGQVGDVGAEVVAADATESVGTGAAAGLDVGRFGADAVGDSDFADGPPGAFGVQQGFGVAPEVLAVTVELVAGDLVDGLAAALVTKPSLRVSRITTRSGQAMTRKRPLRMRMGERTRRSYTNRQLRAAADGLVVCGIRLTASFRRTPPGLD
jgi:hypothetical protein